MKRTTTLFILLSFVGISVSAQGIAIVMLTSTPIVMKGEPKMMKTTETDYGKSGEVEIRKTIVEFDKFSLPTSVATLNEDNSLHTVTYYKYDSLKRVELERHIEDRNVKYRTSRVHFYSTYENDYPIIYRQMNANNVVVSETLTKLNDEGQPIMASLYEPQGNLIGTEIAEYFPEKNKVAITVIDSRGRSLGTDSMPLIRKPLPIDPSHIKYDENNNVIWNKSQYKTGKNYEYEYIYDKKGNCIKTTTFAIEVKSNGKEKRKLDSIFEKEITY